MCWQEKRGDESIVTSVRQTAGMREEPPGGVLPAAGIPDPTSDDVPLYATALTSPSRVPAARVASVVPDTEAITILFDVDHPKHRRVMAVLAEVVGREPDHPVPQPHRCAGSSERRTTGTLGQVSRHAERLMLLDTPSMYFRAFFGVPQSVLAADGTPVNALKGLLDFMAHLVTVRRPTHLVACMDADWRPAWRVAAVPSYKTHRVATGVVEVVPDALTRQIPLICAALDALGVAWVGVEHYEADDVIATLATRSERPVDVVTGDRDLFQVVDDARGVRVLYIARGVARHDVVDEAAITARYGIPGRAYADFALLRGDPSDGLPGAVGIGEKTAAALISRHGSVDCVLAAAADRASGMRDDLRRKLTAARGYLAAADQVVRVVTDVPVPVRNDRLPAVPRDPAALVALAEGLGLDPSLNRLLAAMALANSVG